jgi:microcystin-dependent protein
MSIAINNDAASEALTQFVPLSGEFPARDGGQATFIPLGSIRTFAGNFAIDRSAVAEGQLLDIRQNAALFSLFGTFYGGDGVTTFALPDLSRRTLVDVGQGPGLSSLSLGVPLGSEAITLSTANLPVSVGGGGQPFDNYQPSLPVSYVINVSGFFPSPTTGVGSVAFLGNIVPFAGNFAPAGYLPTDGRLLDIAQHTDLFSILGTNFGGDGVTTFALPDLRGRTIIGTSSQAVGLGQTVGQAQATVTVANLTGQPIDNREPSLGLTLLIATEGIFPQPGSDTVDPSNPYLGEVIAFAGGFAPKGWAPADGRLLSITGNQPLFAILGTRYGGDGMTTFALPDLRNRAVVGTGGGLVPGSVIGRDPLVLSAEEIHAIINSPQDITSGLLAVDEASLNGTLVGTLIGQDPDNQVLAYTLTDNADGRFAIDNAGHVTVANGVLLDFEQSTSHNIGVRVTDTDGLTFDKAFTVTIKDLEPETAGGSGGPDTLGGGSGDDTINGQGGDDVLVGGGGNDYITSGDGNDKAFGDAGNDTVIGASGADYLNGGAGDDLIVGNNGADTLLGDTGNDYLDGGSGDDLVMGGAGNDTALGGDGNDYVNGGDGDDLIMGGAGADILIGDFGNDYLNGENGDDIVFGDGGNDTIIGGEGNDYLSAGAGDDNLVGGSGNDTLFAGPGSDYLQGDAGDDFFVFDGIFQTSLIIDFEPGTASHHDVIQFTGGLFADFADLMAHSLQSATNTVITDAGGHALTLANVVKANLISDDFVFV